VTAGGEERHRLRDGSEVLLRPILPTDKARLQEGLARLSPTSRYRRFMTGVPAFSARELAYLTEVDQRDHVAWIALDPSDPAQPALGVGRAIRLPDAPGVAEIAVTVVDSHHGRGLGTLLLGVVAREAARQGITTLRAWVLASNQPMLEILAQLGARAVPEGEGTVRLDVPLGGAEALPDTPAGRVLRAIASAQVEAVPRRATGAPPGGCRLPS
jgi:RimJ/RimL family protein N-acetyltransferase